MLCPIIIKNKNITKNTEDMINTNTIINHFKNIEGSRNIPFLNRRVFFLLLLLTSLNHIKAQLQEVTTENIRFESEGITLAGTIYTPQHSDAAVVLVHGSGQEHRMKEFASLLAQNGILVLTYDKRGVGESGGTYMGPEVGTNNVDSCNLTLLAKDANAAINTLHERDKNIPIGLVGFSQAGWIIPIAASNNSSVDFMVLFSGPIISTLEQLRFQFFTNGNPDFWNTHTEAEARESLHNNSRFDEHYKTESYKFIDTDSYETLSRLSIPGLWLFGEKDIQIPARLSIEHLNTLKVEDKPYEYCLFSTLGHNLTFSDSSEPVRIAIHWIKNRKYYIKNK